MPKLETQHELIIPNRGLPFKLFSFEGNDGHYVRNIHWHESIEIFAIFEGELDFYINDIKNHLIAGQFIIINSNELHSIHAQRKNFTIVLQIPTIQFQEYLTDSQFILFSQSNNQDKRIMSALNKIYKYSCALDPGSDFKSLGHYYFFLSILITDYLVKDINTKTLKSMKGLTHLSAITSYLEANFEKDITLKNLASTFGYSSEHLSRMFVKYAKTNYKTYLQNIRLEYARNELVNNPSKSLSEICITVGFSDSRAMAKAFKKHYDLLPSELQKQLQQVKKIK